MRRQICPGALLWQEIQLGMGDHLPHHDSDDWIWFLWPLQRRPGQTTQNVLSWRASQCGRIQRDA